MSIQADCTPVSPEPPSLAGLIDLGRVGRLLSAASGGRAFLLDEEGRVAMGASPPDDTPPTMGEMARAALAGATVWEGYAMACVHLRQSMVGVVALHSPTATDGALLASLVETIESEAETRFDMDSVLGELVTRYEELSVLQDSVETIASVMDLDEVSRRILAKARDTLDVDNASLMLIDPETETLRIQGAIGLEMSLVESIRLQLGEEISGWVAAEGKPLLIEDIESHPLFKKRNQERYINRSLLSVPLKIKERVTGVLNVNNKRSGAVFNSYDLKVLTTLASLAAISIENARSYRTAITDRLTRLYNYGYFREELTRKVQQAGQHGVCLSLLMFDIDYFKNFNDKNGHELANVALVRIASICLENCRQKGDRIPDVVARYGGEEFMILLFGVTGEFARKTAERVRLAVYNTDFKGGENQPGGRTTISVGVATYPTDVSNGDELIDAADKALYRAKRAGRNNVQVATAE